MTEEKSFIAKLTEIHHKNKEMGSKAANLIEKKIK